MAKYAVTWDLDSLLPHPELASFKDLFERYRKDLEKAAADSEKLEPLSNATLKVWEEYVPRLSTLMAGSEDLHAFIGCHAAADAENKLYQQIEGQLAAVSPLRSQIFTNLEFALQQSAEADYAACMASSQPLKSIAFFLDECRRSARFRLPKEQELLSADLAVDGIMAWSRLYDRISGSLKIEVMEKGEVGAGDPGEQLFRGGEIVEVDRRHLRGCDQPHRRHTAGEISPSGSAGPSRSAAAIQPPEAGNAGHDVEVRQRAEADADCVF